MAKDAADGQKYLAQPCEPAGAAGIPADDYLVGLGHHPSILGQTSLKR